MDLLLPTDFRSDPDVPPLLCLFKYSSIPMLAFDILLEGPSVRDSLSKMLLSRGTMGIAGASGI